MCQTTLSSCIETFGNIVYRDRHTCQLHCTDTAQNVHFHLRIVCVRILQEVAFRFRPMEFTVSGWNTLTVLCQSLGGSRNFPVLFQLDVYTQNWTSKAFLPMTKKCSSKSGAGNFIACFIQRGNQNRPTFKLSQS